MRKKIEWKVEVLDSRCWRVKVIGGWLVGHGTDDGKRNTTESMCFVPDREHEWVVTVPIVETKKEDRKTLAEDFGCIKVNEL